MFGRLRVKNMNAKLWFKIGCFSAAAAVALGAFGAHGLQKRVSDPKLIKTWETAASYHLVHSLAIVAASVAPGVSLSLPQSIFASGIFLFSGSLYTLVLTDQKWLGAITPFGGLSFIIGWIILGLSI
eukprot:TRINITY_DN13_c3_g1_i3.p1 TRINITY_DN13_c3_g1~~TRINITY_DN13_c3_g1_i3.p1  ORF type:complete len:127 (-),score=47.70 TRINITY_DN13_c3_g1_i3:145-525(-)